MFFWYKLRICLVMACVVIVAIVFKELSIENNEKIRTLIFHLCIPIAILFFLKREMQSNYFLRDSKLNRSINQKKNEIIKITKKSSAASLTTLRKVSSSNSLSKLSEVMRKLPCFKNGETFSVLTICKTDLFSPVELVKRLTLTELGSLVTYAISCRQHEFDEQSFLSGKSTHLHELINAMNSAVRKSRGAHIHPAEASWCISGGNFDALYFCAAMRLVVEWRAAKIVPEDYKAYAVGMNMAKRDFIQNLAKVENGIHRWIKMEAESGNMDLNSPTIAQLLKYELITGIHPRLPRLKDKSAANGILWMIRQLSFQSEIFRNLRKVTNESATKEAITSAYKKVFDRYHGWAIQKVFSYSFNGTPPVSTLFSLMNPDLATSIKVQQDTVDSMVIKIPSISFERQQFDDGNDDDNDTLTSNSEKSELHHNLSEFFEKIEMGWMDFTRKIEEEWFKIVDKIVTGGNDEDNNRTINAARSGRKSSNFESDSESTSPMSLSSSTEADKGEISSTFKSVQLSETNENLLEACLRRETKKAANDDIIAYLAVLDPLLRDIFCIIDKFGMNDPTKV